MAVVQMVRRNWAAIALILLTALIGIVLTRQYGESWDENQFFKYADHALEAYSTWFGAGTVPLTGNTYDNYGPAYVMLVAVGARMLGLFLPWITSDLRHLLYFATFAVGMWAFHRLCRRWLGRGASVGATLLFATQPVIWGHAFISPKDIPFLSFFLLSLVVGFEMVDRVPQVAFGGLTPQVRRNLLIATVAWLIAMAVLILSTPWVHDWLTGLASAAAGGQQNLLAKFASDIRTAGPSVYVQKYFVLFLRARLAFSVASATVLAILWRRVPAALHYVLSIAPAALALGFTTSIRIVGPLVALMVAGYAFYRYRHKALPMLAIYALIALAVMYATWPYLWPDPFGHLLESAKVMAEYPWRGQVLFNGVTYASTDIPRSYLPVLLGIQLSEPTWLMFAAGMILAARETIRGVAPGRPVLVLAAVWFLLPLFGFIVTRSPLYDNFRQVIFILPPVFLAAGLVFEKIKSTPVRAALVALVLLPGIAAGVRLHPYEYIYYNSFIGGESGAFRKFELDYWGTSYREAAEYLNHTALANATVWVEGPTHLLQVYTRPDLKIYSTYEAQRAAHYDYVVALTRFNQDLQSYPDAEIVHVIQRDGALLTVIKKPQG